MTDQTSPENKTETDHKLCLGEALDLYLDDVAVQGTVNNGADVPENAVSLNVWKGLAYESYELTCDRMIEQLNELGIFDFIDPDNLAPHDTPANLFDAEGNITFTLKEGVTVEAALRTVLKKVKATREEKMNEVAGLAVLAGMPIETLVHEGRVTTKVEEIKK